MSEPAEFDPEALQLQSDTSLPTMMRIHKVLRLHNEGWADQAIAEACRLPVRLVPIAIRVGEDRHESYDAEDLNEALLASMMGDVARMDEIARNPGWRFDVKGEHLEGPDGEWQIDTERQIQAQREKSRLVEGIRRLKGSDAPVRRHLTVEELARQETVVKVLQLLKPAEVEGLDVIDGEISYSGPSLALGDGGIVLDDDDDDSDSL